MNRGVRALWISGVAAIAVLCGIGACGGPDPAAPERGDAGQAEEAPRSAPHGGRRGRVPPANDEAPGAQGADGEVKTPDEPEAAALRRVVRVVDATTGEPIAGAVIEHADGAWSWVKGDRSRSETGPDGRAELVITDWWSTGRVGAAGYAPQDLRDVIPSVIRLSKACVIQGFVVDDVSGQAVPGVRVEVFDPSVPCDPHAVSEYVRDVLGYSVSDESGRFSVDAGAGGAVRVECTAEGYTPSMSEFGDPSAGPVTIRLAPGGWIRGVVRDPLGSPVEHIEVIIDEGEAAGLTDESGRFEFSGVRLGVAHTVRASGCHRDGTGFAKTELAGGVLLTSVARDIEVELVLRPAAELRVNVRDDAGDPVRGASVRVEAPAGLHTGDDTDHAGVARFPCVSPGSLRLVASAPGHHPAATEATAREREKVAVSIVLRRGVPISGVVVDDTGAAVPSARVVLISAGEESDRATCGADGSFRVRTLTDGAAHVVATAPGHVDSRLDVTAGASGLRLVMTRCAEIVAVAPPPAEGVRYDFDFQWIDERGAVATGSCFPEVSDGLEVRASLPPGRGVLRFLLPGGMHLEFPLVLAPGEVRDLGRLEPVCGRTLRVALVDRNGDPVSAAQVRLVQAGGISQCERTDGLGRAVFSGLVDGRAEVTVRSEELALTRALLDVAEGAEPVQVVLQPGTRLAVETSGESGTRRAVSIGRLEGGIETTWDLDATNCEGAIAWRVAPGRYVVRCGEMRAEVDVAPDRAPVSVRLEGR